MVNDYVPASKHRRRVRRVGGVHLVVINDRVVVVLVPYLDAELVLPAPAVRLAVGGATAGTVPPASGGKGGVGRSDVGQDYSPALPM